MSVWTQLRRLQEDVGELVASHRREKAARDFTVYQDDPVGFIRDVLKETDPGPWSRQVEIAEAVRDHPMVVVRSCNSVGKDWLSGRLMLWWVYAVEGLVLATGPTQRQVQSIIMRKEVGGAFARAKELPGELYQLELRVGNDGERGIYAFTSTEASRLTGFHAPKVLVVITEAQGVEDWAFEGLMACATSEDSRMLAVGNPLQPSGKFYEINASPNSRWKAFRISAEEHPNIVEGREVIPGSISRAWCDSMAAEWGRTSSVYTARVLGDFPDQGENSLIARSWVNAAVDRFETGTHMWTRQEQEPLIAVDVARYGPDQSVLGVRRGDVLERFAAWNGISLMETADRIAEEARKEGMLPGVPWGRIVVDVVGMGGGVVDRLRQLNWRASEFNAALRDVRDRYLNARAEAFWELRTRLEDGRIAFPRDRLLMDELVALTWKPTLEAAKVQIEDKEQIKLRIGRSPDRADTLAMAFYRNAVRRLKVFQNWV